MSDVLVEPPIAVESKVVQTASPILASHKKKITYTIPHLIAISKSPLCQAPPGLPSLVELKRAPVNKNNRPPTQDSANKKNENGHPVISQPTNDSTGRKGNFQSSQLNSQRQQRQNIGNSKSSSVFQFKGRKSEADQEYLSEASEQGSEISKNKNKLREHSSRKHGGNSNERGQAIQQGIPYNDSRQGGSVSPIPEWSLTDNLPADPAILAQQQHEFAEWKEQHKLGATENNANNLSWFEQLNRSDDASFGAQNNYQNNNLASEQSIDSMFNSMSLQSNSNDQTKPAPETDVQNLDFILKALQNEGPASGSNNFSISASSQPPLQDPAIVAFQDPSIFFAQETNRSLQHGSQNSPLIDSLSNQEAYKYSNGFSKTSNKVLGKPPKIMTSGNVPTAVLKQFSSKGSLRDYNSPGLSPNTIPVKSSGFNLASFLESRDKLKSQSSFGSPMNSIVTDSSSTNFTRLSNSAPNSNSRISDFNSQSFTHGSLNPAISSGLSQTQGSNFTGNRHPISGVTQTLPRSSTLNTGNMTSQKPISLGIGNFSALNSSQSPQASLTGIPPSNHPNISNLSPQGFNYPGINGLPQSTPPYPGFGGPMHNLPNIPMNNFAPNMNHGPGFQFSPYGAPLAPSNPAFMGYPTGAPINSGLSYGSEREISQHFLNRPVSTDDLFTAHNLSQNQGQSRGPPPGNFRDNSYAAWPKPGSMYPPFSQNYSPKSGPNTQHQ